MTVLGIMLALLGIGVTVTAPSANGQWLVGGLLMGAGFGLAWRHRKPIAEDPNPEYSTLDRLDGRR